MFDLQHIKQVRARLEAKISELIEMLDLFDGDCDIEASGDDEPSIGSVGLSGAKGLEYDLELDSSDDEPSLGWNLYGEMAQTFDPDRELDGSDLELNGDETDYTGFLEECLGPDGSLFDGSGVEIAEEMIRSLRSAARRAKLKEGVH